MAARSAYSAFLNQAQQGHTRWWTWLGVFWFGLMCWVVGQIALGLPINVIGTRIEGVDMPVPDLSDKAQLIKAFQLLGALSILFLGAVTAIIFFFVGKASKSKALLGVSGGGALISFLAFIGMMILGQDPEQAKLMNIWIAHSPAIYALMLLSFPPLAIGILLGVKFIQDRPARSVLTAHKHFRWGRMLFTMLLIWLITALASGIGHITGLSEMKFVFDPERFFKYLPITLLLIPLQSATEEIALRGLANQGLGQYIKHPLIVFLITSAAFAALHLANPEVAETTKEHSIVIAMSGYFLFGMFASLMTYIDVGLESAIGMHAANNLFAAVLVGYDNSALPTPTLFNIGLNTKLDTLNILVGLSLACFILYKTRKPPEPEPEVVPTQT